MRRPESALRRTVAGSRILRAASTSEGPESALAACRPRPARPNPSPRPRFDVDGDELAPIVRRIHLRPNVALVYLFATPRELFLAVAWTSDGGHFVLLSGPGNGKRIVSII